MASLPHLAVSPDSESESCPVKAKTDQSNSCQDNFSRKAAATAASQSIKRQLQSAKPEAETSAGQMQRSLNVSVSAQLLQSQRHPASATTASQPPSSAFSQASGVAPKRHPEPPDSELSSYTPVS